MLRLALKMLYGDRAKYAMLICGLTFCSLLMTQQIGVFCGLMRWTTATLRNIQVPIWVADKRVAQVNEIVALRDIEVTRVRSVPGVEWAVPLYWGIIQARLRNGSFQQVQLTGLDAATFVGRPAHMIEGNVEDLRLPNAVVIDQVAVKKFKQNGLGDVKLGDTFEINDHEARIVGICKSEQSFLGQPYIFTTYDRALEFAPVQRKRLSFILVQPKPDVGVETVVERIRALDGLTAFTSDDFNRRTIQWYIDNTGIPVSFGTVVILGIIVGVAIAGQTFYLFVHENLRFMAALKAMGARTPTLAKMVLLQALAVGFVGYGLGVGLAAMFGNAVLKGGQPPFFLPWQVPAFTAVVILFICCLSALIGLVKIIRAEPAVVFR
jgi:putative ABC transport system permease protein